MSIYALPFKYKDIVLAQAILETGWFKSENCIKNNNLFGMRRAYSRVTTSDTTINGYAHYANWNLSVVDYYLLHSVTQDINPSKSRDEYYHYVDRIYSEVGRSYSSQLKNIISRLSEMYPDDPYLDSRPKVTQHRTKRNTKKHRHA
jgi:uncharacterized FlgJ-related protein